MWHGHVERKGDDNWVVACSKLVVERAAHFGRSKKTVSADMRMLRVNHQEIQDSVKWRTIELSQCGMCAMLR